MQNKGQRWQQSDIRCRCRIRSQHSFGEKHRIRLDHHILPNHSVLYPQALYNDLVFELTLALAKHVVVVSDTMKLVYELKNIQLEYKMIRSKTLAEEAGSIYSLGKEFLCNHVMRAQIITTAKGSVTSQTVWVNL